MFFGCVDIKLVFDLLYMKIVYYMVNYIYVRKKYTHVSYNEHFVYESNLICSYDIWKGKTVKFLYRKWRVTHRTIFLRCVLRPVVLYSKIVYNYSYGNRGKVSDFTYVFVFILYGTFDIQVVKVIFFIQVTRRLMQFS